MFPFLPFTSPPFLSLPFLVCFVVVLGGMHTLTCYISVKVSLGDSHDTIITIMVKMMVW